MRKLILIIFVITLLFPLRSVAVTQGNDEVSLLKPSDGQSVSGNYSVEWKITDSDVVDPVYFIDVFNMSCDQSGGNLGRLINSGATKNGENYTYLWDTTSGNISSSLQNQGNYCMRVCAILAEGGSVYSLCDKQSFVFGSGGTSTTNSSPVIESVKEGFVLSLNQVFNYKVIATDPDSDTITFSLLNAPDFLTIDQSTGEISGKPTEVGDIKFIVKVDDGNDGITTEEFIMRVQVEGIKKEIEFSFPMSGSIVTGSNNEIKWKVSSGIQVKTIVLSFSQDREKWSELTRLDRDTSSYKWDIKDIDPGDYYLKVELTDTNNKLFEIISEKFNVSSTTAVSQTEITDLFPTEGTTINNNRPVISANFNTPEGVVIKPEDVKFTLNERIDLTVCQTLANSISCNVVSELMDGSYKAYIELKDSTGSTIVKEWPFTVKTADNKSSENVSSGINTFQLIIIIFAIGFVLIVLPWSVYILLKRRKDSKSQTDKIVDQPQGVIYPVGGPLAVDNNSSIVPESSATTTNMPIAPIINNTPNEQVFTSPAPESPVQSMNIPVAPVVSNISTEPIHNQVVMPPQSDIPLSTQTSFQGVPYQPEAIEQSNIMSQPVQVPAVDIPSPVITQELPVTEIPTPVEPPEMYQQDEIPQWLQTPKNENIQVAPVTDNGGGNITEDIVTKSDLIEGAKVYDPYGIALNSDEDQT